MSFLCGKCEAKLKCLETRSLGDHIYRRYRCPACALTVRTEEVCVSEEPEPVQQGHKKPEAVKQAPPPAPPAAKQPVKQPAKKEKSNAEFAILDHDEDYAAANEIKAYLSRWDTPDDY